MKKLLLFTSLILGTLGANAQLSCAAPTVISANGTFTSPAVTGTYSPDCYTTITETDEGGTSYGTWYSYTPSANGLVTITSNLPINTSNANYSKDTKLSVFTGTCAALTCYDANDDTSDTNYLSTITFPVAAGTTYFIQWDNYWDPRGFQFTFNFATATCIPPYYFTDVVLTANSAALTWSAAVGNPAGYEIEYGVTGFFQGTGTIVTTSTTTATIPGLTAGTTYDIYIRSNCGSGDPEWLGPLNFTTPFKAPYTSGFDSDADLTGWSISTASATFGLDSGDPDYAQGGTNFFIFGTSATVVSNNWVYSAPIYLQANEAATVSFYTFSSADAPGFKLTVGDSNTAAAQTTTVWSAETLTTPTGYVQVIAPAFTATTAGIYYFAFNYTSPVSTNDDILFLDTFAVSSVLSVDQFLNSKFALYPNPASSVISLTNSENILVNGVTIADLNGRTVKQVNFNKISDVQVNVSDLSAGVYMLTINTEKGSVTKKVIKN